MQRCLIMGTFRRAATVGAWIFFYPNPINDFWRIMGLLYFGDKNALYDAAGKVFRLDDIKRLINEHGIAMGDTGYKDSTT